MPGSISVPSSGSFEKKKNIGRQMGHANKKFKKELLYEKFWA
jgi:hypothetical protein